MGMAPGGAARRHGMTALRVAVSVGLILLLVGKVAPADAAAMLRAGLANWPLLLVATALPALGFAIIALRWRALLVGLGVRTALRALAAASLVGAFFNTFLPSTIGGDVMRAWWVRDEVGSATRSLTVVALDRLIGLLAFCAVGVAAAALVPSIVHDTPAFWIVVAFAAGGLAVLALATHPAAPRLVRPLFDAPVLRRVRDKAVQAGEALAGLRRARARLGASFALGVVLQLNVIAQFLVLAAAFETGISLWALAVLVPIVNLITLLPVSINGLGVREGALAALGAPFGLAVEEAVLLAYAWVIFSLTYALIGGVIYLRGRRSGLTAAAANVEASSGA